MVLKYSLRIQMQLKQGYKLHQGKYQLLNVIGNGGFSLTYKGIWNTEIRGNLGKIPAKVPVCIKEYFLKDYCRRDSNSPNVVASSPNGKEVFKKNKDGLIKEAKILSEVHHPNIVSVLEVFRQNNTVYIVMEFIAGQSLKQEVVEKGMLKEDYLLKIVQKIGSALSFIHKKNILHLDIKPSNILINQGHNPKLIDFGISKRYGLTDQQETSTSMLAVSKGYASIEQYDIEGMQVFSPCPDIYSLGASMYHLLTGQVPTESILISTKGLAKPRTLNPLISEKTENVILKAMSINSIDRYQCVEDMLLELGLSLDPCENSSKDEEDSTHLITPSLKEPIFTDNDDDTVLFVANKNSKKKIIYAAIIITIIIPLSIFIFKGSKIIEEQGLNSTYTNDSTTQILAKDDKQTKKEEAENNAAAEKAIERIEQKKLEEQELTNKKYEDLLINAKRYLANEEYELAKSKFQEANSISSSKEIEEYIKLCNNELYKEEKDKRYERYELKMKFGNFVVARNKTTGFFGAIDSEGHEIIACKYLSTSRNGANRSFLDKNDLYDIYGPDGSLIQEGASSYK